MACFACKSLWTPRLRKQASQHAFPNSSPNVAGRWAVHSRVAGPRCSPIPAALRFRKIRKIRL
eukprot:247713-Alexandrium_andersonii.AAC.1